jgi:DNA-binding NtrC family response regulator
MKEGACDFISKPWNPEEFIEKLNHHLDKEDTDPIPDDPGPGIDTQVYIQGESGKARDLMDCMRKIASTDANVLLTGENGTGKNVLAREIHRLSGRKARGFAEIDLGSLSESIFESELFGYSKGAFTDARVDKPGRLETAHSGTLFLDEIGNISLRQQHKILQLIEERKYVRLGSNKEIQADFRLICATNRDLQDLIQCGEFREDLYFRINTVELKVPSLRERKGDIIKLATHFAIHFSRKYSREFKGFQDDAVSKLTEYSWPGNVRELSHVIEKAVILGNSETLSVDLGESSKIPHTSSTKNLSKLEKMTIQRVIEENGGNLTVSARELGISRSTLYLKIEKYGIY